jgi:hypothetical protein
MLMDLWVTMPMQRFDAACILELVYFTTWLQTVCLQGGQKLHVRAHPANPPLSTMFQISLSCTLFAPSGVGGEPECRTYAVSKLVQQHVVWDK